jgi:hypothetical protein
VSAEARPTRPRGIYEIADDELARLLQLPPGQHVVSLGTSWERLSVLIMVEGPGLTECVAGSHPVVMNRWGRFRPLVPVDVSKLSPGAAHAAVLAELGAVRLEDPAALAGRRRILERHAPYTLPDVPDREGPWCSLEGTTDGGAAGGWPCEDYLDAAAGLVVGLPGQDKRDEAIAAAAYAAMLAELGDPDLPPGVITREQAVRALAGGDPALVAKLDAAVLGYEDEADPERTEARPGVETQPRRHRRTPPLARPDQQEV